MKLIKRILILIVLLLLLVALIFVGVGFFNYKHAIHEESIPDKVAQIQSEEQYVSYEDISPYLLKATVSIEDRHFYTHHGVRYTSMARALVSNISAHSVVGGGSTITQQLAKNMYYSYQPSYLRKVSEIFTAYALERVLTKDTILELYVNIINYGDNYFGIKEASEGYFHKEPKDLTLDEATLLAGIPQSPSNLQLSNHMDRARERQKYVLKAMVRDDKITQKQMDTIIKAHE